MADLEGEFSERRSLPQGVAGRRLARATGTTERDDTGERKGGGYVLEANFGSRSVSRLEATMERTGRRSPLVSM